jgi:hypothetical protein
MLLGGSITYSANMVNAMYVPTESPAEVFQYPKVHLPGDRWRKRKEEEIRRQKEERGKKERVGQVE